MYGLKLCKQSSYKTFSAYSCLLYVDLSKVRKNIKYLNKLWLLKVL